MKNYKRIIVFLIIIMIILLMLIAFFKKSQNNEELNQNIITEIGDGDGKDISTLVGKIFRVKDNAEYYTVKAIVDKYIYLISTENTTSGLKLISPVCIGEIGITKENINEKTGIKLIQNGFEYYILDILNMNYVIEKNNTIYFVEGNYKSSEKEDNYDIKLIVALDNKNKTFEIYTEEYMQKHNLANIKENDKIDFNTDSIENRGSNIYEVKNVTTLDMANNYFNDFKNKILTKSSKELYENILNQEYAKKRFKTVEEFNEYLLEKKYTFNTMQINKYLLDIQTDFIDYICIDQYDNYYIFRQEDGVMKYSVLLDTYTLELPEFLKKYNSASDVEKVGYNIQKCIDAINNKDYSYVYKKLDETFKNNNYTTKEDFEDYIKNNLYNSNEVEENIETSSEGDIHIYNIKILNKDNVEQKRNVQIIMRLGEGTDFTMSFNIQ